MMPDSTLAVPPVPPEPAGLLLAVLGLALAVLLWWVLYGPRDFQGPEVEETAAHTDTMP